MNSRRCAACLHDEAALGRAEFRFVSGVYRNRRLDGQYLENAHSVSMLSSVTS